MNRYLFFLIAFIIFVGFTSCHSDNDIVSEIKTEDIETDLKKDVLIERAKERGSLIILRDRYIGLIDIYEKMLKAAPEKQSIKDVLSDYLIKSARVKFKLGEDESAYSDLMRALEVDPSNKDAKRLLKKDQAR